jgi:hypothetical protein
MLYQRESGFIDIVIEPQFKDYSLCCQLCLVRSTDLSTLMSMKYSVRGEIDFSQCDRIYPFTGFGYLDDLAREITTKSLLQFVDSAERNFTKAPAAFIYLGVEEGDIPAINTMLKIMERRSKRLALDSPKPLFIQQASPPISAEEAERRIQQLLDECEFDFEQPLVMLDTGMRSHRIELLGPLGDRDATRRAGLGITLNVVSFGGQ